MSCREDLPVVLERWRRFRGAFKGEDQPANDVLIAIAITAGTWGSPCATAD